MIPAASAKTIPATTEMPSIKLNPNPLEENAEELRSNDGKIYKKAANKTINSMNVARKPVSKAGTA